MRLIFLQLLNDSPFVVGFYLSLGYYEAFPSLPVTSDIHKPTDATDTLEAEFPSTTSR